MSSGGVSRFWVWCSEQHWAQFPRELSLKAKGGWQRQATYTKARWTAHQDGSLKFNRAQA